MTSDDRYYGNQSFYDQRMALTGIHLDEAIRRFTERLI